MRYSNCIIKVEKYSIDITEIECIEDLENRNNSYICETVIYMKSKQSYQVNEKRDSLVHRIEQLLTEVKP